MSFGPLAVCGLGGFRWRGGEESACRCRRRTSHPWRWKGPRGGEAAHSSAVPGKFHGQGSLMGFSPRGHKEWAVTERVCTHGLLTLEQESRILVTNVKALTT